MSGENFMGTKQLTDNYKSNTPGQTEEAAPKKVGDKITYRSIQSKRKRTSKITKIEKTKSGWRYEMGNGNFVYHADLDEQFEGLEEAERDVVENISPKIQNALTEKARFSKLPLDILEEVYRRGRADYNPKMIITEDQWAFGRVNNFISGGKTRKTEDADLWNEISKRNR